MFFDYDCWLTSTDPAVIAFLDARFPGWQKKVCPVVSSIRRKDANPASDSSVNFTVTFSEPVTGVSTGTPFDDFALTVTGLTGATITGVSGHHTPYGSQVAYAFAKELAQAGITVVSGMAFGIDSIAHRGALDAGGKTIAVLGDSLDEKNIYPASNLNLSREIVGSGCLLSDFPIETPAGIPGNFPARNRIIAGLSLGTLVIEAGEKSGTLITANLALEFNRDVFAVPGPIFSPQSFGTNSLIKNGAKVVPASKTFWKN